MTEPTKGPQDESTTLADRVFEQLRRAIVAGEVPPGSKLSEPEMAARFGISRGPLREALRRLESTNLIERRPNLGARVINLTGAQLIEISVVREALEGMAARLAAEHMPEQAIVRLKESLEQQRREVARDDWQTDLQRDGDPDFHYRIAQASGNQRLIGILCDDLHQLARMYRCQLGMGDDRTREALQEHVLIADAIAERDGELAELLMRRHIRASRRSLERRLADDPLTRSHGTHP